MVLIAHLTYYMGYDETSLLGVGARQLLVPHNDDIRFFALNCSPNGNARDT
jgi:hypothetical protein